jgi:hypothetical protein
MSSGVNVHADCQATFQQLSEGKRTLRYIIYKIDDKDVIVEAAVSPDEIGVTGDDHDENSKTAYEYFVKDLKERTGDYADCRYAVFDFKFTCPRPGAGTSKVDKIIFIQVDLEVYAECREVCKKQSFSQFFLRGSRQSEFTSK